MFEFRSDPAEPLAKELNAIETPGLKLCISGESSGEFNLFKKYLKEEQKFKIVNEVVLVTSENFSEVMQKVQELKRNSILVLEKIEEHLKGLQFRGIVQHSYPQLKIRLMLMNFILIETASRQDTLEQLQFFIQKLRLKEQSSNTLHSKTNKLSQKDPFLRVLMTIKGISFQKAKQISKPMKNIDNLILSLQQNQKCLQDIQLKLSNGKTRKLGKALSQRVLRVFLSLQADQIID